MRENQELFVEIDDDGFTPVADPRRWAYRWIAWAKTSTRGAAHRIEVDGERYAVECGGMTASFKPRSPKPRSVERRAA